MSESIGTLYTTKVPGYEEPADIQAALKLYHYGTVTPPTLDDDIDPNSVAGHLKAVNSRVDDVVATGIGSTYTDIMPPNPQDGFIWMDSDDTLGSIPGLVAAYQSTAPSTPALGTLWVDSTNSASPVLKVYNGTEWKAI